MSVELTAPVLVIEGLGPRAASALAQLSIHTVTDLLHFVPQRIHQAVRTFSSINDVRQWQAMAALLQVAGMTPQWAEALVRQGVTSVGALHGKRPSDIHALMRSAEEWNWISQLPTDAQIVTMLQDATTLYYTGVIAGTVKDANDAPVTGATVTSGTIEGRTDECGRFRLLRIPLGRDVALRINHAEYQTLTITLPTVFTDANATGSPNYRLERGSSVVSTLSELDGDELPTPRGQRMREWPIDIAQMRDNDIFVLHQFYRTAPDAKLVSRLLQYADGEFRVPTLRIPVSQLPGNPRVRDMYRCSERTLIKITTMTTAGLMRYKLLLRMHKQFAREQPDGSMDERVQRLQSRLRFLQMHGYFHVRAE